MEHAVDDGVGRKRVFGAQNGLRPMFHKLIRHAEAFNPDGPKPLLGECALDRAAKAAAQHILLDRDNQRRERRPRGRRTSSGFTNLQFRTAALTLYSERRAAA